MSDPNAPAPTEEDLAFWDVMDEEYESNMRLFEEAPAQSTERPAGPPPDFWLKEILAEPLAEDSAYYDPIPSDELLPRYTNALDGICADLYSDHTDEEVSAFRVVMPKLRASFSALPLLRQQQALRLTETYRASRTEPGFVALSRVYHEAAKLIEPLLLALGPIRSPFIAAYMAGPDERREMLRSLMPSSIDESARESLVQALTLAASMSSHAADARTLSSAARALMLSPPSGANGMAPLVYDWQDMPQRSRPRPQVKPAKTKGQDLIKKLAREAFNRGLKGKP